MKKNLLTILSLLVGTGGLLLACGDSSGTGGAGGTGNATVTASHTVAGPAPVAQTGTGTGGGLAVPTLGKQIDRMGRPAVNTALDETFLAIKGATPTVSTDPLRNAAEDTYNQDSDPTNWNSYAPTIAAQLGVLDALDAADPGGCGNQLLCGTTASPVTAAGCYDMLAGVLATDMIWLTTKATTTCNTYLGVEEKALGLNVDDCGGRRPSDDVIATTYTVLSGNTLDDGIVDPGNHQNTFPYLAAPH